MPNAAPGIYEIHTPHTSSSKLRMYHNRNVKQSLQRKHSRMMRRQLLECETPHENIDDCTTIEGTRDVSEILGPIPEQPSWIEKRYLSII